MDNDIIEILSKVAHERWAHWQKYLHSVCKRNEDGSLTIPKEKVERWERQIKTEYKDLSEKEKDSDREQAYEYLKALELFFKEKENE